MSAYTLAEIEVELGKWKSALLRIADSGETILVDGTTLVRSDIDAIEKRINHLERRKHELENPTNKIGYRVGVTL